MHDPLPSQLAPASRSSLYALEVTAKDIIRISTAKADIPRRTPINIAFLGTEEHAQRIAMARAIRACGCEPVPIISSRRLRSREDLDGVLEAFAAAARPKRFLVVGGDPATPAGPYPDSIELLKSGVLRRHAIGHVGIVAYPEGHPKIEADALWRALKWKLAYLRDAGCSVEITTQFGFDPDAILRWIERLRSEAIDVPVRIGVPGPAEVGTLLRFARQFGVVISAEIARGYGLPLTRPLQRVGPERFLERLHHGLAGCSRGPVLYHLYPFGGLSDGARWMNDHLRDNHFPPPADEVSSFRDLSR